MSLTTKFLRVSLAITLLMTLSLVAFADTVRLKDGSIVKGKVIGFRDGQFVILIGEGSRQRQMTFFADEIEAIDFDNTTAVLNTSKPNNNPTATSTPMPRATPTPTNNPNSTSSNPNVRVIGNPPSGNQTDPDRTATQQPTPTPTPANPNKSKTSPIQISAKVLADNTANGWTNTGWVVRKGQRIRISGTGRISLGNGRYSTPSGVASLPDNKKLMKDKPTGGLVAVIGDDNNDFIFIGGSYEFIASRDGALFLGVNEDYVDDNSGAFDVVIEIDPLTSGGN